MTLPIVVLGVTIAVGLGVMYLLLNNEQQVPHGYGPPPRPRQPPEPQWEPTQRPPKSKPRRRRFGPPKPAKQCSICLESVITDIMHLKCSHTFHNHCIDMWFISQGNKTCPNCRKAA